MDKLLIICGPTATGKTALGVKLAKQFNGEIVSADSRQVYKGMDIGTGKDVGNVKWQSSNVKSIPNDKLQIGYFLIKRVKVWLYDVVAPDYQFNVADYVNCADAVIEDIWRRGGLPIVVGGTGFYIKAIIEGIGTLGIPPDWELRKKLESYRVTELQSLLKKNNPQRWKKMNISDKQNPRRLIRAIEVAGKPLATKHRSLDALFIGLTASYKVLYRRIDERVDKRIKEGIEEEIKGLIEKGYHFENSVLGTTIGYREWEETKTRDQIIQRWKFDEHNLARRQMTWFRRERRIYWFDIQQPDWEKKVEKVVKKWYIGADAKKG